MAREKSKNARSTSVRCPSKPPAATTPALLHPRRGRVVLWNAPRQSRAFATRTSSRPWQGSGVVDSVAASRAGCLEKNYMRMRLSRRYPRDNRSNHASVCGDAGQCLIYPEILTWIKSGYCFHERNIFLSLLVAGARAHGGLFDGVRTRGRFPPNRI